MFNLSAGGGIVSTDDTCMSNKKAYNWMWLVCELGAGSREKESGEQGLL